MPCGSCIDKLAYRLMANHKIDMIRAYEFAEKGIERTEHRKVQVINVGNPSDYSQICNACPAGNCTVGMEDCSSAADCRDCPPPSCPAPLANSHLVSNTCVCFMASGCNCVRIVGIWICTAQIPPGACNYSSGTCSYDCDVGYVWNPVTLTCDLIPVVSEPIMDGFMYID